MSVPKAFVKVAGEAVLVHVRVRDCAVRKRENLSSQVVVVVGPATVVIVNVVAATGRLPT